jgi:hypothetical protein
MMPVTKLMTAITIRLAAKTAEGSRGTSPVLRNYEMTGSPIATEASADMRAMQPNIKSGR